MSLTAYALAVSLLRYCSIELYQTRTMQGCYVSCSCCTGMDGALEAFVSIITGPAGPRPEDHLPNVACPVGILWGSNDPYVHVVGTLGKVASASSARMTGECKPGNRASAPE